jgi:hypothetical protein
MACYLHSMEKMSIDEIEKRGISFCFDPNAHIVSPFPGGQNVLMSYCMIGMGVGDKRKIDPPFGVQPEIRPPNMYPVSTLNHEFLTF